MSKTLTVPTRTAEGTEGTSTVSITIPDPLPDVDDLTKTTCSDFSNYTNLVSTVNIYLDLLNKQDGTKGLKKSIEEVQNLNRNGTIDLTTPQSHVDINNFLKTLETSKKTQYNFAATCRAESKEVNLSEFDAQKQTTEESKLRLDGIRNSETQVSYYEGWFPLFRPMSETSLFTLFAISIALLLVSIVAFLRMQGLEIQILTPFTGVDTMAMLRGYSTYIGIAVAAGIGVAFAAVKMNWV